MRKIDNIVVHCSASPFGDREVIDKWHRERGWREIGYSYVILNGCRKSSKSYNADDDGIIEGGRSLDNDPYIENGEQGAHAAGYNANSFGICMIGTNKFTVYQFEALAFLLHMWKRMIPDVKLYGHYQLNSHKTCPNFKIEVLKKYLNNISARDSAAFYFKDNLK